jgi:STE24 endopeptidase
LSAAGQTSPHDDDPAPDPTTDFTPEQLDRSRRRKRETRPVRLASGVLGLALTCVLGFTRLGADLIGQAARPFGGGWAAEALLGPVALALAGTLLTLPTGARSEVVNRRWGLSRRTWGLFWADQAKGFVLGAVLIALAGLGWYALVRALPGYWWLVAAGAAAVLVFVLSFLLPVLVEPLFNKFTPLPDGPLRDRLFALAAQGGVPVREILVSDASKRTTVLNAYVSGIGRSRRIVIWDTTLARIDDDQTAFIAAHELGHAARRDVVWGTAVGSLGLAGSVALIAALLQWRALLDAAGAANAADPRSFALVMALGTLLGGIGGPLYNLHSRRIERRADQFGLDLTGDPATVVECWRQAAVTDMADLEPGWTVRHWTGSHPPIPDRIAHARRWAAEHAGSEHTEPAGPGSPDNG